jgi:hypothetical protein
MNFKLPRIYPDSIEKNPFPGLTGKNNDGDPGKT